MTTVFIVILSFSLNVLAYAQQSNITSGSATSGSATSSNTINCNVAGACVVGGATTGSATSGSVTTARPAPPLTPATVTPQVPTSNQSPTTTTNQSTPTPFNFNGGLPAPLASNQTSQPSNGPPVANAGTNETTYSGYAVALDGTGSTDPDGNITSYSWKQTSGPAVTLESLDTPTHVTTFTAPTVSADTVLKFSLTVKDDKGAISNNPATVTVTVKAVQKPQTASGNTTGSEGKVWR